MEVYLQEKRSLTSKLATFNFIVCFVGYPLITTILLPLEDSGIEFTRLITIPYRIFALTLASITMLFHILQKVPLKFGGKVFIFFWIMLIIRIFYDLVIRDDYPVDVEEKIYIWTFSLGVCFIPMLSIYKSFNSIDFLVGLKAIFYIYAFILTFILATNYNNLFSETNRLNANAAFNSIAFGHFGVSGILLSMHYYKTGKIFSIYTFLLSIFFMFQAGSRGPLLTFIILILFIFIANKRNVKALMYLFGFIGLVVLSIGTYLVSLFSQLAPVLYSRVFFQTFDGEEDGREPLLLDAVNTFLQNPIFGGKFAINLNGLTLYSHNLITDALMALGVFGGIIIIYLIIKTVKISFQSSGRSDFILYQLLLQQILFLMLSSAIYLNPLVNILWIIPFIKTNKFMNN